MPTLAKRPNPSRRKQPAKAADDSPPVRLKTRAEVRAYLAAHVKPVRYGPKGQPIYALADIAKLNVLFRDDAY